MRFFVRAVLVTEQVIRKQVEEEVTEQVEVTEVEGALQEVVCWRGVCNVEE